MGIIEFSTSADLEHMVILIAFTPVFLYKFSWVYAPFVRNSNQEAHKYRDWENISSNTGYDIYSSYQ